ncbi:MAG: binding domain protein [Thermoanaerobacterium sp.]|jgi:S1 RNA binding domain.|uniref:S1 RNA binding domain protein n=1 Tax=Thermoanaerobacterium butyriciformans TaxID=1702242 RepID=A0ABS4NEA9_9THEO|nr:S1 domain-containing RNA-binding protein [Thermoanaerobacterium butyriciformans]MBP2072003.1 S1 RNA binding domain protein [Thermoanaerobacterium butyriciformans]MDI3477125.1 binding domain protein [Thermoanaerobacterium sp.]MDK2805810.1 binding domain protein [Thermoanaerobacterium sp.]MDN5317392.1 binding domain protein [Thermoanaerobacterium sp.]
MPFQVGEVVEGTVLNITDFGAFVQLPEGKTGLVHISEVANTYVKDINEFLKENDKVKVKILSMDKGGRISLSIKKALPKPKPIKSNKGYGNESYSNRNNNISFEERISKFLKDSDERQQQLKKNFDSKRRGGGYKRNANY